MPGYLIEAAGLRDLSLSSFTHPIEEGSEPPASAVSAMTALVTQHRIKVLFYNSQAVSPITKHVNAAAKAAGVPVVGAAETVPAGLTFQAWQIEASSRAAAGARRMTRPVVSVEGLGLRFGDRELLRDLTFELERGEFLAVLGPNGAGRRRCCASCSDSWPRLPGASSSTAAESGTSPSSACSIEICRCAAATSCASASTAIAGASAAWLRPTAGASTT